MMPINRLLSGGLPVRPSGGSGRRIGQETLDTIESLPRMEGRIANDYPSRLSERVARYQKEEDIRIAQYTLKQQDLQANARAVSFEDISGNYDPNRVVGRPYEYNRTASMLGDESASNVNRVIHSRDLGGFEPPSYSLLGRNTDNLGDEYTKQQSQVARQRELNNPNIKYNISDLFNTKEAREFQYKSGTRGVESPGFKISPEQQDRLYGIDFAGNYTNEARIDRVARVAKGDPVGLENIPAHEYYGAVPTPKGNYDEVAHMRSNNATSTNAMSGGTSGPTPPSSSNTPINPGTTPTGSTDYSGYYQPSQGVVGGNTILDAIEANDIGGLGASIGVGALVGGVANYGMGGEFSEGAIMGGLGGGAMKIGARAIQQNQAGIESYLQRTALGDAHKGMNRTDAAAAIREMRSAGESAGFMQNRAFGVLKSEAPSLGMQSRYMVMSGSALSGVAFTGRRNDKRRGFNSHRGNRI